MVKVEKCESRFFHTFLLSNFYTKIYMSIVLSSIVPHPPVLLPAIGKENIEKIKSTKKAFDKLKEKLSIVKPDRIIVISPHGQLIDKHFSANIDDKFSATFENFGDFTTKVDFVPDFEFTTNIKNATQKQNIPFSLYTSALDYGSSIPLNQILDEQNKEIPVSIIHYSNLSYKKHYQFGEFISEEIYKSNKKTAVIASGDLSHRLLKDSPAGFHAKAVDFDKKLIDLLSKNDHNEILNFNKKQIIQASECGFRSILILLGILNKKNVKFNMLSYEYPFGVGYLVADYDIM